MWEGKSDPGGSTPRGGEKLLTSTTKKRPRCKPRPGQLPWRQAASSTRMQPASRNRTQAGRDPKLPNPPTAGSTSFGWNSRALRGPPPAAWGSLHCRPDCTRTWAARSGDAPPASPGICNRRSPFVGTLITSGRTLASSRFPSWTVRATGNAGWRSNLQKPSAPASLSPDLARATAAARATCFYARLGQAWSASAWPLANWSDSPSDAPPWPLVPCRGRPPCTSAWPCTSA